MPDILGKMVLPITHAEEVVLSPLGKSGPILGAAHQAICQFFQDMANAAETNG